jgi:hypothetical protein
MVEQKQPLDDAPCSRADRNASRRRTSRFIVAAGRVSSRPCRGGAPRRSKNLRQRAGVLNRSFGAACPASREARSSRGAGGVPRRAAREPDHPISGRQRPRHPIVLSLPLSRNGWGEEDGGDADLSLRHRRAPFVGQDPSTSWSGLAQRLISRLWTIRRVGFCRRTIILLHGGPLSRVTLASPHYEFA